MKNHIEIRRFFLKKHLSSKEVHVNLCFKLIFGTRFDAYCLRQLANHIAHSRFFLVQMRLRAC